MQADPPGGYRERKREKLSVLESQAVGTIGELLGWRPTRIE